MTYAEDLDLSILKLFRANLPRQVAAAVNAILPKYAAARKENTEMEFTNWASVDAYYRHYEAVSKVWTHVHMDFETTDGTVWLHCQGSEFPVLDEQSQSWMKMEFHYFVDYIVNEIPILKFVVIDIDENRADSMPTVHEDDLLYMVRVAV